MRIALLGYVELIRGTPILLQLFVLYYGLAAAVRLPAFIAALLGLALNYAAYEANLSRRPRGDPGGTARGGPALGLSERQVLTLVRAPQAFRRRSRR
jgi:polar amino acid transport system substrate-binding protein